MNYHLRKVVDGDTDIKDKVPNYQMWSQYITLIPWITYSAKASQNLQDNFGHCELVQKTPPLLGIKKYIVRSCEILGSTLTPY